MSKKSKARTAYVCTACHEEFSRWAGRCPSCEAWNSLEERTAAPAFSGAPASSGKTGVRLEPIDPLSKISSEEEQRMTTGIADLDLVLGGGLVPGAFVLVGGEPGVGKSTLLLEMARAFVDGKRKFYYFTGEESVQQVALRARRMNVSGGAAGGDAGDQLFISRETDLDNICTRIARERPALAAIDSIQTVYGTRRDTLPGSTAQLKEAALMLLETAKSSRVPIVVTGHITKDGAIAGPRLLEHMVDTVLYFESDRLNHYRMLRAVKNRFGPVGEAAFFEMYHGGLQTPAGGLRPAAHSPEDSAPGRLYSAMLEGSRAIGVEVQSLVTRSPYGPARRITEGLDNRRLILIAAVLEKFLKVRLAECDIFANLAGGLDTDEPALDLAVAAAILSSYQETVPGSVGCVGEVGLSGEVRPVARLTERIAELERIGCRRILVPAGNEDLREDAGVARLIPLRSVGELAAQLGAPVDAGEQ